MAKKSIAIKKENEITLQALAVNAELTQDKYLEKLVNEHLEANQVAALSTFKTHLTKREKEIKEAQERKVREEKSQRLEQSKKQKAEIQGDFQDEVKSNHEDHSE